MSGDGKRTGDDSADAIEGDPCEGWPVALDGVTETLVATRGPNGRWNVAALGLFGEGIERGSTVPATARTWGRTRTRGNFRQEGGGYVLFPTDPVAFVSGALSVVEREDPLDESAAAWVRVSASSVETGREDGTGWEAWELTPLEAEIREEQVPTLRRGFSACVEASVAASRLGVSGYDDRDLRERIEWCEEVVARAGTDRDRKAMALVSEHAENESL